jgi:putative ABC transport system substrate-binding protein
VGVSLPSSPETAKPRVEALQKGLAEAGLLEGRDYVIALRYANGRSDRIPEIAKELQALNPAVVILAGNTVGRRQLQPTTPVVFANIADDPVKWRLAQSYARPGGMITGNVLTALGSEDTIADKRITLFKELVPGLRRLGMLGAAPGLAGAVSRLFEDEVEAAERAASRLSFDVRAYRLKTIEDLEDALTSAVRDGADGLYLSSHPILASNAARSVPMIAAAGKPTVGAYLDYTRLDVMTVVPGAARP